MEQNFFRRIDRPKYSQTRSSTLLHQAAFKGLLQAVKKHIRQKTFDVDVLDPYDRTPLYLAVAGKHFHVTRCLLKGGANAGLSSKDPEIPGTPLHRAAAMGNIPIVELLLEHSLINAINDLFQTPLDLAVLKNHMDTVKYLIRNGASIDFNSQRFLTPHTALQIAAKRGNLEMTTLLVQSGAYLDSVTDSDKRTPLHLALTQKHQPVAYFLIKKGAKISQKILMVDELGMCLHLAIKKGDLGCAQQLLEAGVSVDFRSRDFLQDTLLHAAVRSSSVTLLNDLLSRGAAVNVSNINLETPLHCAASQGHLSVVKQLLDYGSCVNSKNRHQETPLFGAIRNQHMSVAYFLIEKGAWVTEPNKAGLLPLHVAAQTLNQPLFERLIQMPQVGIGSLEAQKVLVRFCLLTENEPLWKKLIVAGLDLYPRLKSGDRLNYLDWVENACLKRNLELMFETLKTDVEKLGFKTNNVSRALRVFFYCFKTFQENQRLGKTLSEGDSLNPTINTIYNLFVEDTFKLGQSYKTIFLESEDFALKEECESKPLYSKPL